MTASILMKASRLLQIYHVDACKLDGQKLVAKAWNKICCNKEVTIRPAIVDAKDIFQCVK